MKTFKQITSILFLICVYSCTTNEINQIEEIIEEEVVDINPKNVQIILTTTQSDFDEVVVSYYDFEINDWNYGPRQFEYDANGNPEPIIISLPDYEFDTIEGDAYRKNSSPSGLKVQIFIDDVLVKEEESFGTDLVYAQVFFDYTIVE
jgi:hypothetical protein